MKSKSTVVVALVAGWLMASSAAQALNYGVVFSGGADSRQNYERYYDESLRMYQLMTTTLGYDEVHVLFSDGGAAGVDANFGSYDSPVYVDTVWSDVPAAFMHDAQSATLQGVLADIGESMVSGEDCFHFWAFDHGGGSLDASSPDDVTLTAWGGSIDDDVFAGWIDNSIRTQNPIAESFVFGECFAGGMVDDLNIGAGSALSFAAWAANAHEYSYGSGWVDAWADGLELGLRNTAELGQFAIDNDPFAGPGGEHPGMIGDNFHIVLNTPAQGVPDGGATLLLLGLVVSGLTLKRKAI